MKYLYQPGEGDTLALGPPWSGEVAIKVDPQQTGGPLAVGLQTLAPGTALPMHRHLHGETMVFVHKGQGRATVNDQSVTVVPGSLIYVPREAWYSLRNTGTGALQVTWVVSPPGLERFFREFSQAGAAVTHPAMEEMAHRYGIEFRPAGESGVLGGQPAAPHHGRRRRRGRGRGGRSPVTPPAAGTPTPLPSVSATTIAQATSSPPPSVISLPAPAASASSAPGSGSRHRRRRGRGGRGRGGQAGSPRPQAVTPAATASGQPPVPAPKTPRTASPPGQKRQTDDKRRRSGGYRRRVKEVYMGGRWVRVEGEGPVISP